MLSKGHGNVFRICYRTNAPLLVQGIVLCWWSYSRFVIKINYAKEEFRIMVVRLVQARKSLLLGVALCE